MVDFKSIFDAAKFPIGISLAFNLVLFGIEVVMTLLGYGASALTQNTGSLGIATSLASLGMLMIVALLLAAIRLIGNLAIICYAGYRAAKKGLSMVNCGFVGSMTYGVVAIIMMILGLIVNLFGLGVQASTNTDAFGSAYSGAIGAASAIIGFLCVIGVIIIGLVINFVVGLLAGLIGGAK